MLELFTFPILFLLNIVEIDQPLAYQISSVQDAKINKYLFGINGANQDTNKLLYFLLFFANSNVFIKLKIILYIPVL